MGTTTGRPSAVGDATCGDGGGNAPDAEFLWTVPSFDTFTFDTIGSSFDTLLSLRDATCGGGEVACDDDAAGSAQSQITKTLFPGQTLVIVIDGSGTASGAFTLHINVVPTPTM